MGDTRPPGDLQLTALIAAKADAVVGVPNIRFGILPLAATPQNSP